MVELKYSEFIDIEMGHGSMIDMQVREHQDDGRVVYLGQDSSVIIFFESDLDKLIEFLHRSKGLETNKIAEGFLK